MQFLIIYGLFYQPAEVICALFGFLGAEVGGRHIFHGCMSNQSDVWEGELVDKYGPSEITDVVFKPGSKFEFTKQYRKIQRTDSIRYCHVWNSAESCWTGNWVMTNAEGCIIGRGKSRCITCTTSPSFFDVEAWSGDSD